MFYYVAIKLPVCDLYIINLNIGAELTAAENDSIKPSTVFSEKGSSCKSFVAVDWLTLDALFKRLLNKPFQLLSLEGYTCFKPAFV